MKQTWICEVHQQIVPDSRSSCTEGSVAEVSARPTDEKRIRVSAERSLLGRALVGLMLNCPHNEMKQFQNCFQAVVKLFCFSFISSCGQFKLPLAINVDGHRVKSSLM